MTVQNLVLKNVSTANGAIDIKYATGIIAKNNVIQWAGYIAIQIIGASNGRIEGNEIMDSSNGIYFNSIHKDSTDNWYVGHNHIYDLDVWAVVKGTKKKKLAFDFISFATGTKPLSGMTDVAYGPTRKSSSKYIDSAVVPQLPTSHLDKGVKANGIFWADFGESLGEKFNEWLLK